MKKIILLTFLLILAFRINISAQQIIRQIKKAETTKNFVAEEITTDEAKATNKTIVTKTDLEETEIVPATEEKVSAVAPTAQSRLAHALA